MKTLSFKVLFKKMCSIFDGSAHNFGKSDATMTFFSEKILSNGCIGGLMPNLNKKSWNVYTSNVESDTMLLKFNQNVLENFQNKKKLKTL